MTLRYLISGRVQGVGFRNFAYRHASSLALSGWVRNLPDGRVEVVASGSSEALHEFQEFLKAGPRHAQVDSVQASEVLDERDEPKTFDIKH